MQDCRRLLSALRPAEWRCIPSMGPSFTHGRQLPIDFLAGRLDGFSASVGELHCSPFAFVFACLDCFRGRPMVTSATGSSVHSPCSKRSAKNEQACHRAYCISFYADLLSFLIAAPLWDAVIMTISYYANMKCTYAWPYPSRLTPKVTWPVMVEYKIIVICAPR